MREDFSVRLKKALEIRHMKPIKLSEKLNINRAIVSQYLSGRYKPNQKRVFEISEILNVNPAWLMGFNVSMESEVELIDELEFDVNVVNILKDSILNKISNLPKEKKVEILEQLDYVIKSLIKEMKGE